MTLTVAVATPEGVWMASDRIQGAFNYAEIAQPKIYAIEGDGITFLAGFAGSPRVVQAILRLEPPPLDPGQPLESWLTCWCDTVYQRAADMGLMKEATDDNEPYLAGQTDTIIATHGRVFIVADNLQWTEPKAGWAATGGAAETWAGAWEAYRTWSTYPQRYITGITGMAAGQVEVPNLGEVQEMDSIRAARLAWSVAQRHHRIGPLADELTLTAVHA